MSSLHIFPLCSSLFVFTIVRPQNIFCYQDPYIGSQLLIGLMMFVVTSAFIMSFPVMTATIMIIVSFAVVIPPNTARTCKKQDTCQYQTKRSSHFSFPFSVIPVCLPSCYLRSCSSCPRPSYSPRPSCSCSPRPSRSCSSCSTRPCSPRLSQCLSVSHFFQFLCTSP